LIILILASVVSSLFRGTSLPTRAITVAADWKYAAVRDYFVKAAAGRLITFEG